MCQKASHAGGHPHDRVLEDEAALYRLVFLRKTQIRDQEAPVEKPHMAAALPAATPATASSKTMWCDAGGNFCASRSLQCRCSPRVGAAGEEAHMPAALPAATPVTASSKTRQPPGRAGGENSCAARRKISGSGFPFFTWSPAGARHVSAREHPAMLISIRLMHRQRHWCARWNPCRRRQGQSKACWFTKRVSANYQIRLFVSNVKKMMQLCALSMPSSSARRLQPHSSWSRLRVEVCKDTHP